MSILYHERPGVYSEYEVSRVTASGSGVKTVAVIGISAAKKGLYSLTSYGDAAVFGTSGELAAMLKAAYENGAGTVLAYSVEEDTLDAYKEAFAAVFAEKAAACCAIASAKEEVQTALRDAVVAASGQKGECIGIVGLSIPEKQALLERAAALNCERTVLVGPDVYRAGEESPAGGFVAAAALCGLLAAQEDPALPLNGAVLQGFTAVTKQYEETEIDALVRGGVTVLEAAGGKVTVLRGITTKTTEGGESDTTYRELNTVLVIDDVIPGIRSALAARFSRAKNNAVTRAAIRSQVIVELESRVQQEIIDGYENVTVEASAADANTCIVAFGFTVTGGLNRIRLTAHISV